MQRKLGIEGMSCGHCVAAVKEALQQVEGVQLDNVAIGSATVTYDPATVDPQRIAAAIEDAGYRVVEDAR